MSTPVSVMLLSVICFGLDCGLLQNDQQDDPGDEQHTRKAARNQERFVAPAIRPLLTAATKRNAAKYKHADETENDQRERIDNDCGAGKEAH